MARHFMARASEAARLTPRAFGEDAMAALAGLHLAGQCPAAAQRHRLAVDHGAWRRARAGAR